MKTKIKIQQYIQFILLIAFVLLGIYTALITYKYETIVRGVLGGVLLYLLFYYIKASRTDLSIEDTLSDPKKVRHFVFAFFGPLISFWATGQVFDMIQFLFKK